MDTESQEITAGHHLEQSEPVFCQLQMDRVPYAASYLQWRSSIIKQVKHLLSAHLPGAVPAINPEPDKSSEMKSGSKTWAGKKTRSRNRGSQIRDEQPWASRQMQVPPTIRQHPHGAAERGRGVKLRVEDNKLHRASLCLQHLRLLLPSSWWARTAILSCINGTISYWKNTWVRMVDPWLGKLSSSHTNLWT